MTPVFKSGRVMNKKFISDYSGEKGDIVELGFVNDLEGFFKKEFVESESDKLSPNDVDQPTAE
jgi:hypothetical protein